ncbi:MAG TPA: hypothetical protein VLS93_12990 [Anaeromyxobacteraceae bacterium]|nr:hypothetical protein [Anaeromyxobacteraceae bacterium]
MVLVYEQDRALADEVKRELEQAGYQVRLLDTWAGLPDLARTLKARGVLYQLDVDSQTGFGSIWRTLGQAGVPLVATGTRGRIYEAAMLAVGPAGGGRVDRFRGLERPFTAEGARTALEEVIHQAGPPSPADERRRRAARLAYLGGTVVALLAAAGAIVKLMSPSHGVPALAYLSGMWLGVLAARAAPLFLGHGRGIRPPRWLIVVVLAWLVLLVATVAVEAARRAP